MERITKNWRTTTLAILVLIAVVFLLYTETVSIDGLSGFITMIAGGGVAGLLIGSKDPKKKK